MDIRNTDLNRGEGSPLQGLHVLAMLPPAKKDRTKYLVQVLGAAKARWDWKVSILCTKLERSAYVKVAGADGRLIEKPHLLREAAWERDERQVVKTEELMREAERSAGLTAGRIVLAAAHSVGRGFNLSVRHIRKYALVRRVIRDNTEAFRIVLRLFRFADDMLNTARPDMIYAFEWATPLNLCVWLAAQRRGIPCVALRYSKIIPDHAFWTTDRTMMNLRSIELARLMVKKGSEASDAAHAKISAFRDQPKVINYIATRWSNRLRYNIVRWHVQNARTVVRETINAFRGQDLALREPPFSRFMRYYHSIYLSWSHQKYFTTFKDRDLAEMKYVYFPLHKEAELAQTFQASLWHDQRNTVRILASLLPHGYRLLVREHRMNLGHRPTRSFQHYSKLPNVTLIDPYDSQFKYLRHADLVVTENGSSGWEGLLLGSRVLTLSDTFYDGAGLGTKVSEPDRLNAAILEALAAEPTTDIEARDRALGCVFDAERETTFAIDAKGLQGALDRLAETTGETLSRVARPHIISNT